MDNSTPAREDKGTRAPETAQGPDTGFRADLPLAILESVRQHDRPAEVLEDEDLSASLPRRLGLTGVVESQIHRYRLARKRREQIPREDVADLLRLVLRRPDSEPILREAGYEIARHQGRKALYRLTGPLARALPDALSSRMAARFVRRLMSRIGGGAPVRVTRQPFRVEMNNAVTAANDQFGVACILYGSAIEEAIEHATGRRPNIVHVECEARAHDRCAWEMVEIR
jgi:predicted hydrocarbon binding protein